MKLRAGLDEIIGDLKDEFMARAGKEWSPEMHKADEAEPDDFEILDILRESTRPVIIDAIAVAEEEARAKIRLAADNE